MFKSDPMLSNEESQPHPYPQQQQEQQNTAPLQEGNCSPVRHGEGEPEPGITEPSDPEEFCENNSVRYEFMGKVFFVLSAQMLFMLSTVAVFTFRDPVRIFVSQNPALFFIPSLLFFLTTYSLILFCHGARRQFPWNLILLFTFTLAMSFLAGVTSSCLDTKAVFVLVGIMTYECFIIAVNFTYPGKVEGWIFVFYILAFAVPSFFIFMGLFFAEFMRWIDVVVGVYGFVFCSSLLAGNTLLQNLVVVSVRPNEYVFGALAIYIAYPCCPSPTYSPSDLEMPQQEWEGDI
ncbi:protein lifeguard 2-like [Clarias gariepinus]